MREWRKLTLAFLVKVAHLVYRRKVVASYYNGSLRHSSRFNTVLWVCFKDACLVTVVSSCRCDCCRLKLISGA